MEAILGHLGRLGALWGLSWEPLGPLWSHLGRLLDDLGGPLGRLGLSENLKGGKANMYENLRKVNDFGSLGPSGGPLGGLWGRL